MNRTEATPRSLRESLPYLLGWLTVVVGAALLAAAALIPALALPDFIALSGGF